VKLWLNHETDLLWRQVYDKAAADAHILAEARLESIVIRFGEEFDEGTVENALTTARDLIQVADREWHQIGQRYAAIGRHMKDWWETIPNK
jgi:hypothetical protein